MEHMCQHQNEITSNGIVERCTGCTKVLTPEEAFDFSGTVIPV